ncbi:MAG: hypothetical protein JXA74_07010 [Anaerolineae bacterium]|nr:hypothetical protein [Anaerolineae bacterium]
MAAVTLVGWLLAGRLVRLPVRSWVERLALCALLGIVAVSWIGTILACLGIFRWWLLLGALFLWIVWTQWRAYRRHLPPEHLGTAPPRMPAWVGVTLIGLLALASWLYSKPAETLLLTTDASVYTIGGILLTRDGTLSFAPEAIYDFQHAAPGGYWEPTITLPKPAYLDFIEQFSYMETSGPVLSHHYGPFFLWSILSPDLEIGFLSLPKVWSAICVWLLGPSGAVWHVGLFGVLGLALLYALGSRLSGSVAGLVGVLFLGASLLQLWFARFPVSEVHTQVLLLGGLYLCRLLDEHRGMDAFARPLALWSASGLALLTLARFEALLLVIPVASLLLLGWQSDRARSRDVDRVWLIALLVTSLLGTLLSVATSPLYFVTRALTVLSLEAFRVALAFLVALFLGAGVLAIRGRLRGTVAWFARASQSLISAGWLVWGALALWLLVSRPWAYSLPGWLVQYWTRPGLVLSILGAFWIAWSSRGSAARAELSAFYGVPLVFLFLYSASPMVAPVHPWAMRRLVPIVMPALALGASHAIVRGAAWIRAHLDQSRARGVARCVYPLAALLVLVQAFTIGQRAWPLLRHHEYAGMWSQLEAFAGRFPPGAVLLFDDGEIGWKLAPTMEMVFDLPSFVLQDREAIRSDSPVTDRLIQSAFAGERQVFFIVTDDGSNWRPPQWHLEGQFLEQVEVPVLRHPTGRPPNATDLAQLVFTLDVYQVLPVVEAQSHTAVQSVSVRMGPGSYPHLTSGFYAVETTPEGDSFRWTQDEALIVLPWPGEDTAEPADFCLKVDLSGWRPEGERVAHLVLEAEGIPLLEQDLDPQARWAKLEVSGRDIENVNLDDLELSLQSNTWNAAAFSNGADERDLGIVLYGLELIPGQACPQ